MKEILTYGRTDGWTGVAIDIQTNRHVHKRRDGQEDKETNRFTDQLTDRKIGEKTDEWTDRRTDGRIRIDWLTDRKNALKMNLQ